MLELGRILEAVAAGSRRWKAVFIQAGKSKNGVTYTPEELKRALSNRMFESQALHAFPQLDTRGRVVGFDHIGPDALAGRTPLNQWGVSANPVWNDELQRVEGEVVVLGNDIGGAVQRHLESLEEAKALGTIGLSIDADGVRDFAGRAVIRRMIGIDLVSHASAGGAIEHRIAASIGGTPVKTVLELLRAKFPRLTESLADSASDFSIARHISMRAKADEAAAEELAVANGKAGDGKRIKESADYPEVLEGVGRLLESVRNEVATAEAAAKAADKAKADEDAARARLTESDRVKKDAEKAVHDLNAARTALTVDRVLGESKLPEILQTRIRESFAGKVADESEVRAAVDGERKVLDTLRTADAFKDVRVVREKPERLLEAVCHLLAPSLCKAPAEGMGGVRGSMRRMMLQGFGVDIADHYGSQEERERLRESVNATTLSKTMADALRRTAIAWYGTMPQYLNAIFGITNVVPATDFRTKHVIVWDGYGEIPIVPEGDPYLPLDTPSEKEETYAVQKRGGTEDITMEQMLNDDMGRWQSVPKKLGFAALFTLFAHVMKQNRKGTQDTMSDSKKLTDTTRTVANEANLTLTADGTGYAQWEAVVKAMFEVAAGSLHGLGIVPKFIITGTTLAPVATRLFQPRDPASSDTPPRTGVQVFGAADPIVVVDPGESATGWTALADPNIAPVFELAFLNDQRDPQFFFDDREGFGGMFTHDKVTAKLRHIYRCKAIDFRGIYRGKQ